MLTVLTVVFLLSMSSETSHARTISLSIYHFGVPPWTDGGLLISLLSRLVSYIGLGQYIIHLFTMSWL